MRNSNRYNSRTHENNRQTLTVSPRRQQASLAWRIVACLLLCLSAATARAQLTIEIIGGGADQIPITVLPFADEEKFQQRISQIVSADLRAAAAFKLRDDRQRAAAAVRADRGQLSLLEEPRQRRRW